MTESVLQLKIFLFGLLQIPMRASDHRLPITCINSMRLDLFLMGMLANWWELIRGLGGVAITINGLCSQDNFSYSDVTTSFSTVPTYSWTIQVISHEFGHLLGSPHTHGCYWNDNDTAIDGCGQQAGYSEGDCPQAPIPSSAVKGTIMSYCHLTNAGISFSNGFGPQPAALILSTVNGSACLSTDCINTCINTVSSIEVINSDTTSAEVTWTDALNSNWEVSASTFTGEPINWIAVTSNAYTFTQLNTQYVLPHSGETCLRVWFRIGQ